MPLLAQRSGYRQDPAHPDRLAEAPGGFLCQKHLPGLTLTLPATGSSPALTIQAKPCSGIQSPGIPRLQPPTGPGPLAPLSHLCPQLCSVGAGQAGHGLAV